MTFEELKKAKIEYMKQRDSDAVTGLNTAISRLMLLQIEKRAAGQTLTESDVTAALLKTQKDLEEERDMYRKAGREERAQEIQRQINAVIKYLPKMLSAEEIKQIISRLPDKSVPTVMKKFKTDYAGQCDMKLVSDILKTL